MSMQGSQRRETLEEQPTLNCLMMERNCLDSAGVNMAMAVPVLPALPVRPHLQATLVSRKHQLELTQADSYDVQAAVAATHSLLTLGTAHKLHPSDSSDLMTKCSNKLQTPAVWPPGACLCRKDSWSRGSS